MNLDFLEKVKRLTIAALVSDDMLMGILVLKGGNALNIAYDITNRGSIDIDFSIEKDFNEAERERISKQSKNLLNNEFQKEGYTVFDVKFYNKPQKIDEAVKEFWGGYRLDFKIIESLKYRKLKEDRDALRRNAIPITDDNSTIYYVEISKYEYIAQARKKDIDGSVVYVYSPEMIAIEKLRALCQQVGEYKEIVKSMTPKSRARDFYDIYNLTDYFGLDYTTNENIELMKNIFNAKRVPLNFILKLENDREFHRGSWDAVLETISQTSGPWEFDECFDFVIEKFQFVSKIL